MLGLRKDTHCLKYEGEVFERLMWVHWLYNNKEGKLLKVLPLSGEGGHPAAPERMLEVLHSLAGRWSFELWRAKDRISFYFWAPDESVAGMLKSEIAAHYSNAEITEVDCPTFPELKLGSYIACARVHMTREHCYPFETKFVDDPLKGLLMPFSYMQEGENAIIQVTLRQAKGGWSSGAYKVVLEKTNGTCVGWFKPQVVRATDYDKAVANAVSEKARTSAFQVEIRICASSDRADRAVSKADELARKFSRFNADSGNRFGFELIKEEEIELFVAGMGTRTMLPPPMVIGRNRYAMTTKELATIIHLPRREIDMPDIEWASRQQRMAPPVNKTTNGNGVVVCMNRYRDRVQDVVLTEEDLNRHVAVFGKTGTGKSTMIASMALEKINAGESVVVIDPHGDLIKEIVPRIKEERLGDVYLDEPLDRPLRLNAIEIPNRRNISENDIEVMKDVVISDVVSTIRNIFYKDTPEHWGARLDHVFSMMARGLLEKEGTTLADMYFILTDEKARRKFAEGVTDPVVKNFLDNELPKRKFDDIDTTVTKVSKFTANKILRRNLCQRYGTFNIKTALDGKKVILVDLSKGNLGENNSKILGSAIVTQIWMSVLQRVKQPEKERVPTYLYVDEFQNFASWSFSEILSESRKYRLSLTLATQYTGQVSEEMWKGIDANVNTLISFQLGAFDAQRMSKCYTNVTPDELLNLPKYTVMVRKGLDTTSGGTYPLGKEVNDLNFDVIDVISDERGYEDDSMASEFVEQGENNIYVITALQTLSHQKNRKLFSVYEIQKELEKKEHPLDSLMFDGIVMGCVNKGWVKRIWNGETNEYQVTEDGINAIDGLMGNPALSGAENHRRRVREGYDEFDLNGCVANIIPQGGSAPRPDYEVLDGEYMKKVSGGKKINGEVEDKTTTKPARLLQNVKKAMDEDRFCKIDTEDGENARTIYNIITRPYKVGKDGKCENYHIDAETEFVPEMMFSRPPTDEDFGVFYKDEKGASVKYVVAETHEEEGVKTENKTKAIEEYYLKNRCAFNPGYVAKELGIEADYTVTVCGRLEDKGILKDLGWGLYIHTQWAGKDGERKSKKNKGEEKNGN